MYPDRQHSMIAALLLSFLGLVGGGVALAQGGEAPPALLPADRLLGSVNDATLAELITEVLKLNPEILEARAKAFAAEQVAPQVRALADPSASLTAYLLEPETRVGPQELSFAFSQAFPWFGTLSFREQAAFEEAVAAWSQAEAVRVRVLTETRRWYLELCFLQAEERELREERRTLSHFEELARARYESGKGSQQGPIKIQAEITRIDLKLLGVTERWNSAVAVLNALRQHEGMTPIEVAVLPAASSSSTDLASLRETAWAFRPEVAAADARISASEKRIGLARKKGKPNFKLGLGYTLVGGRTDAAGRASPPPDDGEDVLALTAGASLPVWRGKVRAGIEQGAQLRQAASHAKLALLSRIERELADLASRLRISRQRVSLHDDLLIVQAEQSLSSGLAAYSAGSASALDLLDAERILFAVRISAMRARADHAIARARLEGAVASPLTELLPAPGAPAEDESPAGGSAAPESESVPITGTRE